jgi:hypothetical protein
VLACAACARTMARQCGIYSIPEKHTRNSVYIYSIYSIYSILYTLYTALVSFGDYFVAGFTVYYLVWVPLGCWSFLYMPCFKMSCFVSFCIYVFPHSQLIWLSLGLYVSFNLLRNVVSSTGSNGQVLYFAFAPYLQVGAWLFWFPFI